MRVEDWLASKLTAQGSILSDSDVREMFEYLSILDHEELELMMVDLYDYTKMSELSENLCEGHEEDEACRFRVNCLIKLRFLEVLRDNVELVREIMAMEDFNPK